MNVSQPAGGQIVRDYRSTAIWLAAIYVAAMLLLPPLVGFRLDFNWLLQLYAIAAIPAITLPWIIWRKLDAIRPATETTTLILVQLPPILVVTFVSMRFNLPLADTLLVRMDQALGFNWPAFERWVDTSHALSWTLGMAYQSVFLQIILLPAALCFLGFVPRAYRLVLSYGLLVAFSSAIAVFFPSLSAYSGYGFDPGSLTNINGMNGWLFHEAFVGVRSDPDFVLGAKTADGIVTFPSIHAGIGALLVWAGWSSKLLRWPLVILNVLMTIGAVTHGAHYFVDIASGLAVAGLAAWTSVKLEDWSARPAVRNAAMPRGEVSA